MADLFLLDFRWCARVIDADPEDLPDAGVQELAVSAPAGIGMPARLEALTAAETHRLVDTRVRRPADAIGIAEHLAAMPVAQGEVVEFQVAGGVAGDEV